MGEPSIMQRLLREKALGRYLNALERGDISAIISVLEQAERDMVLERMILEVHETYQTEEAFLAMVQEESLMEFKEGIHKSRLKGQGELPEEELLPVPGRRPGRYTRILQALAAVLIVVCLLGGVLVYLQVQNNSLQRNTQTAGNVYNWCVSSGAVIDSTAGVAQLNSIVAISADDIWAAGSLNKGEFATNSYRSTPLIEHWNGSEWSVVPGADITPALNKLAGNIRGSANKGGSFNSLSVISATDIWAVGSESVSLIGSGLQQFNEAFIEHWDGRRWQLVPDSEVGGSSLNSVLAISANNVWAVGSITSASNDITRVQPLVEHWDGNHWNSVQLPSWLAKGLLNSVSATSANDIWVAGAATIIQPVKSLVAHWNGKTWMDVTQPTNLLDGTLSSVYAISPNDAWIVGIANDPIHTGSGLPLFGHWDGHTWKASTGTTGVNRDSSLYALGGNGANDVWAVGSTESGQALIEHWNGESWQLQHQQRPAPGYLSGVAVIKGRVWAVGSMATVSNAQNTLKGALIESSC